MGDVLLADPLLERSDGLAQLVDGHDESGADQGGSDAGGRVLDVDRGLRWSRGLRLRVHVHLLSGGWVLIIPPVNLAIYSAFV